MCRSPDGLGRSPQVLRVRVPVRPSRLARACARIIADGFATDDGEDVEELRCVAAPIRDRDGAIVASIGISAPVTRFPVSRFAIAARQVSDAARRISLALLR